MPTTSTQQEKRRFLVSFYLYFRIRSPNRKMPYLLFKPKRATKIRLKDFLHKAFTYLIFLSLFLMDCPPPIFMGRGQHHRTKGVSIAGLSS